MKQSADIMGMPIRLEIVDSGVGEEPFAEVFAYFRDIEARFSPFREDSEVTLLNRGDSTRETCSPLLREILARCEQTKEETNGYFDIRRADGKIDPSGFVKGWAIKQAADLLLLKGWKHFTVEAGGDIQTHGLNAEGSPWRTGIRNPFNTKEVVKILLLSGEGIATSGTYERGQHIYDPHKPGEAITDIMSMSVVGSDVCEADRFATAAFAMGREGIRFIEGLPGCEGYMIDREGIGTETSGFAVYTLSHVRTA